MRSSLLVLFLVVAAAAPAAAQGMPSGGGLDKFMKDSAQQQRELQGLIERKKAGKAVAAKKAKAAKAPKHAPAGATDFKPSGSHPTVDAFLASANLAPAVQQQMRSLFDGTFQALDQMLRPNSVASSAGFALGVSIEIANEVELPEDGAKELVVGVNDMLAASGEFKKLGNGERQALHEAFVMTGALLTMMKTAGESDPAMKAQAQTMAKQVIAQVSGIAAK